MEFRNEGLPSVFKRLEKISGYKVLFIYDEISSYTVTGKVEKATIDGDYRKAPVEISHRRPVYQYHEKDR